MTDEALLFEVRGQVAWLIMNRPEAMNSINLEMVSLYEEHMQAIQNDDNIRVVVLTGNGKAFCAGADLIEVTEGLDVAPGEMDFLDRLNLNVLNPLRNLNKPVIAAVNGITLAGGLEMAMCADIVIASEKAKIGDGHANFGVYPGAGGAALLPRIVPPNVAKYLLFTGNMLSAAEMKTYGFVNEVVPADELLKAAQTLAEHIAAKSPAALKRMKAVANEAQDKTRDDALTHEQYHFRIHQRSWDMKEGLAAFAEKRKPEFQGR